MNVAAPTRPCSICGAPMIWTMTAKGGKMMPVDAEPDPEGNVWVWRGVGSKWMSAGKEVEGATRHTSHFAKCVNAKRHRRAK